MDDYTLPHPDCPPEVAAYWNNPWGMRAAREDGVGSGGYLSFVPKVLADAAIAALEARVAELERQHAEMSA